MNAMLDTPPRQSAANISSRSAKNPKWLWNQIDPESIWHHGVLAPNAKLRSKIVPAPPERATEPPTDHASARETPAHELGPAAQTGLRHRH